MTGNKYNQRNKIGLSTKMDRRTDRQRGRAAGRYGQMVGTEDPATGSHAHRHQGQSCCFGSLFDTTYSKNCYTENQQHLPN